MAECTLTITIGCGRGFAQADHVRVLVRLKARILGHIDSGEVLINVHLHDGHQHSHIILIAWP